MRYIFLFFSITLYASLCFGENYTVEMLNKLEKRNMVFSPEILRVNAGDTVIWQATD